MGRHLRLALAIATLALGSGTAACVGPFEYSCASDQDCLPGSCQESGYCAFADEGCHSGDRYGDHAGGELAGMCVPVQPPEDIGDKPQALLPAVSADRPGDVAEIYWSAGDAIFSANVDGTNLVEITLAGDQEPAALAIDIDAGTLYFATVAGAIKRVDFDGSGLAELVDASAAATGLALDPGAGKLYFSASAGAGDDDDQGSIGALNTDGSGLEVILGELDEPRRITIDTAANHLYWADAGTGKIQRADTDGSKVRDLVTGLGNPRDVVIAAFIERIFFTDANSHSLSSAKLNGSSVVELVSGIDVPRGLGFDNETLSVYWSDAAAQLIRRANSDGSGVVEVIACDGSPRDIALRR